MISSNQIKRVPWAQLEEFVKLNNETVGSHMKKNPKEKQETEKLLPETFTKLHSLITRILRDNDIMPNKEEHKVGEQVKSTMEAFMQL